jgi:F-box protein 21
MSLDQFPDEIIQHVLTYLPAEDNLAAFQLASRRMCRVAREPVLWRQHCRVRFRFWDAGHALQRKMTGRASSTDWMGLFVARLRMNARAARLLDDVIEAGTVSADVASFGELAQMGYDVQDYLLEQARAGDEFADVLARRYYSNAVLKSIHRAAAIEDWMTLQRVYAARQAWDTTTVSSFGEPGIRLERLLGAFDRFVLGDSSAEPDILSGLLDGLASSFKQDTSDLDDMNTRQRALALNRWLRSRNLTGMDDPDRNYRNLRNCFIGQALRHEDHDSLPIISCAIYSCIAERVKIDAGCCLFPIHVHVVISSKPGETLDNGQAESPTAVDMMYLDPYGSDEETKLSELQKRLAMYGVVPSPQFFCPAPPSLVARRTASNITAAHDHFLQSIVPLHEAMRLHGTNEDSGNRNLCDAAYAACWSRVVMAIPKHFDVFDWDHNVRQIMHTAQKVFPGDMWLVNKYLMPLYRHHLAMGPVPHRHGMFGGLVKDPLEWLIQETHHTKPGVVRRSDDEAKALKFRVGQVVRHRRFSWVAIVTGWEFKENARDRDTGKLRKGRAAFYTTL